MAHDTTPPRSRMILVFMLLSPAFLLMLVPFFHTYFIQMTEGEAAERIAEAPPTTRDAIFETQRHHLDTGPMPIERAMRDMASRGRDASPVIAPTPSDDTGALSGWGPMANEQAVAAAEAAHEAAHAPPPPRPPPPPPPPPPASPPPVLVPSEAGADAPPVLVVPPRHLLL